jgi:hypothetical protein
MGREIATLRRLRWIEAWWRFIRWKRLILGVIPLVFWTSTADAQVYAATKYISMNYGSLEGEFWLSARLSTQFRKDMGVEAVMGFVPSKGELSDIYGLAHYRYHLWPDRRFVPHLVAGAGAVTLVGNGRREVNFVASFGGGVQEFITDDLALRADAENYTVFLEGERENRQGASGGIVFIF